MHVSPTQHLLFFFILVAASASSSKQCFDTVGWVTGWASNP